jgi:methionyl-tRNA synthetase
MRDVVQAVESGLEDLSISRPSERLTWGIRVPQDTSQTIYVWLDALMNYVTKAGYPWAPGRDHAGGWPADCHVIGKDIVRFHCIYWPAFLMALGLPLPKRILTHAHWTLGGSKMSKSTGRVVDPFLALDRFGPDVMRYYLAHDGGIQDDGNYDNVQIIKLYNNFLWAQVGNLVSRITRGKKWSVRGAIERIGPLPASEWADGPGSHFYETLLTFPLNVAESLDAHDPRRAVRLIADLIRSVRLAPTPSPLLSNSLQSNQYVQMSEPWKKTLHYEPGAPGEEVDKIVYLAAEALRMAGILLQPYMPNKAKTMLDQLGIDNTRRTFEYCAVGRDLHYGTPTIDLGVKYEGALFPPLSSEE